MAAKQKKNAATSKELMGAFEALGVPLVKAPELRQCVDCHKDITEYAPGLTKCAACEEEPNINTLADAEAEEAIKATYDETHRQGFAVVGLAVLLHKATCHRYHFDKVDCAFEGGKKFEALQVAQSRALWIDYATQIANLSGVEAAQQTMALIFGKGEFARLGKSRFYTKEERAAYEAKNAAKKQELDDFLKGYEPGSTGDAKAKPSADDQKFTQTYAGGTPEQLDEEVNKEQQADIKKFLGEE